MKKKIGIVSNYFCAWSGGTDLIRYILGNLIAGNSSDKYELYLIIPTKNLTSSIKSALYPLVFFLKNLIRNRKIEFKKWPLLNGAKFLDEYFSNIKFKDKLFFIYTDYINQNKEIKSKKIDIILPCVKTENYDFPWMGYLFDFQHEYLPEFFSKEEIDLRRKTMKEILFKCKVVFTNSNKTKTDASKFYGKFPAKIYTIPYSPCIDADLIKFNEDIFKKFKLKKDYFIICNQFWRHKNHETAIKAFSEYVNKNGKSDLVFTGNTADTKFPKHFKDLTNLINTLNLNDRVKILGLVEKKAQIALVKNSRALIQPTLFEGGPGGGSCRDAIAVDTQIFASDIEINKEINCGEVKYFEVLNPQSLSDLLINSEKEIKIKKDISTLINEGEARKIECGKFLLNIIDGAIT
jgi:glycosyltransferase involved in cell wall biosynthesis